MRTIHTEIGIAAPAARVWDVLMATDRWVERNPFAKVTGRFVVGERLSVEIAPPGKKPMKFTPTVVKLEPGREVRWLGHLGFSGIFDGEHGFRLVSEDMGRCRFEQFETFTGLFVVPVMWMVGKATREGFEAMSHALKGQAESM